MAAVGAHGTVSPIVQDDEFPALPVLAIPLIAWASTLSGLFVSQSKQITFHIAGV
jgi:hypothetical protein